MNETKRKVALVILYNHNFEKNIPVIRRIYGQRFSTIIQLMPFYYGKEEDVISVYGNSFHFHTYIAQAKKQLLQTDCDDFLIIGDDVLLNPAINEYNVHEQLEIRPGAFYIDKINDIASGEFYRPVMEAGRFTTMPQGLDASANRVLPTYEEAEAQLRSRGMLSDTVLRKSKPYLPLFKKPFIKNLYFNAKILKARYWHIKNSLKVRLHPKKMQYPCVFAYSDLINIPREQMEGWCRHLEIFATWRMFVELAIPTAMALIPDADICYASNCRLKTGNVWFPQDPIHRDTVEKAIAKAIAESENDIEKLTNVFPAEYMYLHPVKLSRFR